MKTDKFNDVLVINDVTCYGKVSSLAMIPVMTKYNIHPYVLPTAIVSNTMDYGSSVITDTTEFMRETIDKWRTFDFSFSNISTGLINNSKQIDLIIELIDSTDNPFVLVDPIMADDGKLYPGMYENAPSCYKRLAAKANILTPNFTEATILTGLFEGREILSYAEYDELSEALLSLGAETVVISGCKDDEGRTFNLVARKADEGSIPVYYDSLPTSFIGTGDIFSACIFAELINGTDIISAVEAASALVYRIIESNANNTDHFDLRIETVL